LVRLEPGEKIDELTTDGLKIIQAEDQFRYTIDAVLLSWFATVHRGDAILDLGTGTGIIPLLLLARQPELHITALELNEEVAERARRSVQLNQLQEKIKVINADLRSWKPAGHYQLVVTNPPYLPLGQGKLSASPKVGMARHELTCTLEEVIQAAARAVGTRGRLAMVYRSERLAELMEILPRYRFQVKRLWFVHGRAERNAAQVLLEAYKDGGPGLKVLPPLFIYDEQGRYTPAMRAIYQELRSVGLE